MRKLSKGKGFTVMSEYTPQFAPFVMLAFLGTAFLLILSALVLLVGWVRKSRPTLRLGMVSGATIFALYGGTLVGLSLFSKEAILPVGSQKYFCEIDCHLAYSVVDVRVTPSVGPEMQLLTSNGKFVVVQLKTWFDPATISAYRGDAPLTPNSRKIRLLDSSNRSYTPSTRAQAVLSSLGLTSTPLSTPLRPGESYATFLVFEVPVNTVGMRLLVTSADPENALLWTDENSVLHKKIYFQLAPA